MRRRHHLLITAAIAALLALALAAPTASAKKPKPTTGTGCTATTVWVDDGYGPYPFSYYTCAPGWAAGA